MKQQVSALGRFALAGLFATVPRLTVSVNVHGLEYDTRAPRTFYAITHKRDFDAFVPVPMLLAHRGRQAFTRDLHFAMRGDGFQMGFLSRIVRRPSVVRACAASDQCRADLCAGWVFTRSIVSICGQWSPGFARRYGPMETWGHHHWRVAGRPQSSRCSPLRTGKRVGSWLARPASSLLKWRYFPVLAR